MFARIVAVALVASSFLSSTVAEPIPAPAPGPTPAPVLVDRQNQNPGSVLNSILSDGTGIWNNFTSAAGSVATLVTSIGGQGYTFITAKGGSVYELATSGANGAFVTVTSIGGQAYTVVKSDAQQITSAVTLPTLPTPTTKGAASSLRPIDMPLCITVSLVSTVLAVGLGAQFVF